MAVKNFSVCDLSLHVAIRCTRLMYDQRVKHKETCRGWHNQFGRSQERHNVRSEVNRDFERRERRVCQREDRREFEDYRQSTAYHQRHHQRSHQRHHQHHHQRQPSNNSTKIQRQSHLLQKNFNSKFCKFSNFNKTSPPTSTFDYSNNFISLSHKTLKLPDITCTNDTLSDFMLEFNPKTHIKRLFKSGFKIYLNKKIEYIKNDKKHRNKNKNNELAHQYVQKLLEAKIIEKTVKGKFISNCTIIPKANGEGRLIVNYKKISKFLRPPKIFLPSVFKLKNLLVKNESLEKIYFMKIDLKNAFFNIPLNEKARHITTFNFNGNYYRFRKMPFGLSIAPFACQTLSNCIVNWCRQRDPTIKCWAHLDDFLFFGQDSAKLKTLVHEVVKKLESVQWLVNRSKSIIDEPVEEIEYLGVIWDSKGIKRTDQTETQLEEMVTRLESKIEQSFDQKELEKVAGTLNYYLKFYTNGEEYLGFIFKHLVSWNDLSVENRIKLVNMIRIMLKENFLAYKESNFGLVSRVNFTKSEFKNLNEYKFLIESEFEYKLVEKTLVKTNSSLDILENKLIDKFREQDLVLQTLEDMKNSKTIDLNCEKLSLVKNLITTRVDILKEFSDKGLILESSRKDQFLSLSLDLEMRILEFKKVKQVKFSEITVK